MAGSPEKAKNGSLSHSSNPVIQCEYKHFNNMLLLILKNGYAGNRYFSDEGLYFQKSHVLATASWVSQNKKQKDKKACTFV